MDSSSTPTLETLWTLFCGVHSNASPPRSHLSAFVTGTKQQCVYTQFVLILNSLEKKANLQNKSTISWCNKTGRANLLLFWCSFDRQTKWKQFSINFQEYQDQLKVSLTGFSCRHKTYLPPNKSPKKFRFQMRKEGYFFLRQHLIEGPGLLLQLIMLRSRI